MKKVDDKAIWNLLQSEKTREHAFALIVKTYTEMVYWKIRHIVLNHDDADDILQNTFLKAWNNIQSFQNKSRLSTWLCSIAIHESLDFLRKKKRDASAASDELSVANQLMADEYFDGDEAHALLQQAIALLPDVQKTVFCLRYYDNMKYSEMAQILHTSEGALKASYHIAVTKITSYLKLKES